MSTPRAGSFLDLPEKAPRPNLKDGGGDIMSAPMSVNAKSDVKVKDSCNGPCCCFPWGKKKHHHKRTSAEIRAENVNQIVIMNRQLPAQNNEPIPAVSGGFINDVKK